MTNRIVHMHIPKTAGTSVNKAFEDMYPADKVCQSRYEPEFKSINASEFDFFRGHIGFDVASSLNADIVCVLRDPIDRFLSVYFFWRELQKANNLSARGPQAASLLSIEAFVEKFDEVTLIEELYNRVTWQIAHTHHWCKRSTYLDSSLEDLLTRARDNLKKCAVVGRVENIPKFVADVRARFEMDIEVNQLNVTKQKRNYVDVPLSVRRRIVDWVYLDLELYWSCDKAMRW